AVAKHYRTHPTVFSPVCYSRRRDELSSATTKPAALTPLSVQRRVDEWSPYVIIVLEAASHKTRHVNSRVRIAQENVIETVRDSPSVNLTRLVAEMLIVVRNVQKNFIFIQML